MRRLSAEEYVGSSLLYDVFHDGYGCELIEPRLPLARHSDLIAECPSDALDASLLYHCTIDDGGTSRSGTEPRFVGVWLIT